MAAAPFKEQGATSFNFGVMLPFFAGIVQLAFHIRTIDEIARSYRMKNIPTIRYTVEHHLLPRASKCVRISPISTDA